MWHFKGSGSKPSPFQTVSASAASKQRPGAVIKHRKNRSYGDRGSWLRFLTKSFHGVLGASSMLAALASWIVNAYVAGSVIDNGKDETNRGGLPLALTLLSVLTSTVLSIHSSLYMLKQSPKQNTIVDCWLELRWSRNRSVSTKIERSTPFTNSFRIRIFRASPAKNQQRDPSTYLFRIRVVDPTRQAFHQLSMVMQYANARILLLLQRRHWQDPSSPIASASGILLWGLVALLCLRMLLGEKFPSPAFFAPSKSTDQRPISSITSATTGATQNTKTETTLKPLPPFWKNGNSYCFVLPMIGGVCADFAMSAWCEHRYFSLPPSTTSDGDDFSLFRYHSDHWVSIWHLQLLQVAAHVIAFAFTLAFRKKRTSKKKDTLVRRFCNMKTLYWVCTIGVYVLVLIGIAKAKTTLRLLG